MGNFFFKDRYIIGVYRDRLTASIAHGSLLLQPIRSRMIAALAVMYKFKIWSNYMKLGDLKTAELLRHKIFINDPVTLSSLEEDITFQPIKLLYGLYVSGDMRYKTLNTLNKSDIKLFQLKLT